jgi:mannose-1-phosphate guanylyltransferase
MRAHAERDAVATIALHPVDDPSHFGLVRREEDGEVRAFVEKPSPDEVDTDEVNAGAYVLERAVVDLIPRGAAVSIEREVFPRLVGQGLYGRRLEGYWMDIGTPERYLGATWDILEGRVETDVGTDGAGPFVEEGAAVDAEAEVGPRAVVGAGSAVGAGATLSESVVLRGCEVGAGATITRSILADGVRVGEGASVGPDCVVGREARIEAGAAVGEGARIGPGETVA